MTMRTARPFPRVLQSLILLAPFILVHPYLHADDDDEVKPVVRPQAVTAKATAAGFALVLSKSRQQQSGLKTLALAAFSKAHETIAYGRVVDISPLLDLRARFRSAQSELAIAKAATDMARKNHARVSKLHAESIIPTRDLIQTEAQLAADQARQDAASRHMREVREEALQSFGEELFKQAVESESPLFAGLLQHTQVLALIALPANLSLPKHVRSVRLNPVGDSGMARQGRLVAPAPRTEESTQGETWYFVADAAGLRSGMRLDAWIPQYGTAAAGVLIPQSAVVWRDGQPWVYVQTGDDHFARRPVGPHQAHGSDWFVALGFAPGEPVVVVGGQMLLSEEQRSQSPKKADDD
jgi:hypothetical protein